jgi:hypothetical protein
MQRTILGDGVKMQIHQFRQDLNWGDTALQMSLVGELSKAVPYGMATRDVSQANRDMSCSENVRNAEAPLKSRLIWTITRKNKIRAWNHVFPFPVCSNPGYHGDYARARRRRNAINAN